MGTDIQTTFGINKKVFFSVFNIIHYGVTRLTYCEYLHAPRVTADFADKLKKTKLFPSFPLFFFYFIFSSVATDSKDEEIRIPKRIFLGMYRSH